MRIHVHHHFEALGWPAAKVTMRAPYESYEDGTQRVIVDGLRLYGYLVTVTTRRPKRCPHCER